MVANDRRFALVLGGILLAAILILMGLIGRLSLRAEEHRPRPSGFVLPQKHKSTLTRSEQRGRVLYEYYCALCHGKRGAADGFNSFTLSKLPKKHTDATYMATLSDTQIQLIIREGGAALGLSPESPPWGGVLADREILDLTAFIRTLSRAGGEGKSHDAMGL